jgi:hypothetical protein
MEEMAIQRLERHLAGRPPREMSFSERMRLRWLPIRYYFANLRDALLNREIGR